MLATDDITQVLDQLSRGSTDALDRLLPSVYEELRGIARRELRRERPDHTLNATALVHEAYLRLANLNGITWEGRAHFFGAAARSMRRILISYARMKTAEKRGSGAEHVPLHDVMVATRERPDAVLALDEALSRLEEVDERQARVVECRYFAGMNVEETATALEISPATVKRDWALARAWLNRELAA
ncbi:MAG: sigma-70 family RNA polymerase sigma factor [Gemmatimonadota bacterium]|jgi:RNA polymerase sigma factor (TIGR02999 family)